MSSSKFACFDGYRKWVIKNAEILSQVETLGRMTSYLIAGKLALTEKSICDSSVVFTFLNLHHLLLGFI